MQRTGKCFGVLQRKYGQKIIDGGTTYDPSQGQFEISWPQTYVLEKKSDGTVIVREKLSGQTYGDFKAALDAAIK